MDFKFLILFFVILTIGCVQPVNEVIDFEPLSEENNSIAQNIMDSQVQGQVVSNGVVNEISDMEIIDVNGEDVLVEDVNEVDVNLEVEIPVLVNGKTVQERVDEAYANLHNPGSATKIVENFPDLELVYVDEGPGSFFPLNILPFQYFYSVEGNITFNICSIDRTVFICEGKQDFLISQEDIDSGKCILTPEYLEDPRL